MVAPRLLPKRQVIAEVAKQKEQQIKEGMVIAQKIDSLRGLQGEEEQKLDSFRKQAIQQVQKEIDGKIKESDLLDQEIRLKQVKSAAISPSVQEQWERINEEKEKLSQFYIKLEEQEAELKKGILLNSQKENENEIERQKIQNNKKRTDELLGKAEKIKDDIVKELMMARSQATQIISEAEKREEVVKIRERDVQEREMQVTVETQTNANWEVDLSGRERKLKENQKIFIKSQEYIKKKNNYA